MNKINDLISIPRRKFLGYCGATATLIATTASSWSAMSADVGPDQTAKSLKALAEALEGDLLLPNDEDFEPTSSFSWNRVVPERRPDLIVMAESQADVVRTINFARENDRRVVVRGGAHSWCASSLRQGGILLDLSGMEAIEIDPVSATATIEPNVVGLDLIDAAAPHGLAFPIAHCPSVPMSGFLLNGGNGLNFNRWGSACSNVTAIDLVLADGREVTATSDEHSDLFWAARGAGPGFFAVATRYQLKLHPRPNGMMLSSYTFPGSAAGVASELLDSLSGTISSTHS